MTKTLPTPDVLTVYGAGWCWDCRNTRRYLDSTGVAYRYVDLGTDRAAQALLDDAGYRAIPVVVTPDGTVLIEPSERELAAAIGSALPDPTGPLTAIRDPSQPTGRKPALRSRPMSELLETSHSCKKIHSIS